MSLAAFLASVVEILEDLGVPYMLTGSLASAYYATPRATQDVDVVIDAPPLQIDEIVNRLLAEGFYVSREAAHEAWLSKGQFNAIDPEQGWKVDLIVRRERGFSVREFSRRRRATLMGVEVSLTTIEDLILAKLEWSSIGDSELQRRDIIQLLESAGRSYDRAYVEGWVGELGLRAEWSALLERAETDRG